MPTILVVEDEPMIRSIAAEILEDAGFKTIEACNADEAIAILKLGRHVQFVFTDINMPGSMDGAKLAFAIHESWPPIHIVITSGRGEPAVMPAQALFMSKPYTAKDVVAAMRSFQNMH